jgi:hypothetical protein
MIGTAAARRSVETLTLFPSARVKSATTNNGNVKNVSRVNNPDDTLRMTSYHGARRTTPHCNR